MTKLFKNKDGQVRWGYKFLSVIVIWEILVPIAMLLISVGILGALTPALQARGMIEASGRLTGGLAADFQSFYFILAMCIQNTLLVLFCTAVWKTMFRLPLRFMGFWGKKWLKETGAGFLFGAALVSAISVLIYLTGSARPRLSGGLHVSPWLAGYFLMFVFVGIGEETGFRGYAMGTLRQTENPWLICVLPAFLFGIAHSTNANFSALGCVNIILAGLLFGVMAYKTGRLWLGIGFHIAWNFFQGCVFGFEVSGIRTPSVITTVPSGPALLNGGAFGLEGSIVTTAVLAVSIGAVLWWFEKRQTP